MPGCNYAGRFYRPRAEILNGAWTVPGFPSEQVLNRKMCAFVPLKLHLFVDDRRSPGTGSLLRKSVNAPGSPGGSLRLGLLATPPNPSDRCSRLVRESLTLTAGDRRSASEEPDHPPGEPGDYES